MHKPFVAYYRVSTQRQGVSGLGLDAQRAAVLAYLNGGAELVGEFVEVESGKRNDRPQLAAALAQCRKARAVLVIAKLDRLARNMAFIANLMDSGVEFIAVDMPMANRLTMHILAAVAEHERTMISERTKAALAQAKERGRRLGWANPARQAEQAAACRRGAAKGRARAAEMAERLRPVIDAIRDRGVSSLAAIAEELTRQRVPAARGGAWHAATVHRLLLRLNAPNPARNAGNEP